MVTAALAEFMQALHDLSARTGVGIHADQPIALDIAGLRFAFDATCRPDGSFTYASDLSPYSHVAPPEHCSVCQGIRKGGTT